MGPFQRLNVVPAITASSAYSARNVVGGLLSFKADFSKAAGWFLAHGVVLRDRSANDVAYDLALYDVAPTHVTDKLAVANDATDLAGCLGTIPISGMSKLAASSMGIITGGGLSTPFRIVQGKDLYGLLITNGGPTYGAVGDLSLDFYVIGA